MIIKKQEAFGQITDITKLIEESGAPVKFQKMTISLPTFHGKKISPSVLGIAALTLMVAFPRVRNMVLMSFLAKTIYKEMQTLETFKIAKEIIEVPVKA